MIFRVWAPHKRVSYAGTNVVPEKFKNFYKHLSIHHAVSSSYNNQSNGQTEASLKLVIRNMKRCYETNDDVFVTDKIIIEQLWVPSLVTILFIRSTSHIVLIQ